MKFVEKNINSKLGKLIVSMDIEDWPQSTWDHTLPITKRAAKNTEFILELLTKHNCRITMFVLGKFAERFPSIVKRMASEGHEIASHGYGHVEVFKQSPELFWEDVARSKDILENITGQPVFGYRAPDYSITSNELWALEILADIGIVYDSSIFPTKFTRYGIVDWPPNPVNVNLHSGKNLVEMPLTTLKIFGSRWPVAGGGYHRLLPWPLIKLAINQQLRNNNSFMSYCHPYEFDPNELLEIDVDLPLKTKLHQGIGRRGFLRKFEKMLSTFEIARAIDLIQNHEWPNFTLINK